MVERLENQIDERPRWDIVMSEVEYYSDDPDSMYFKNPKGEVDVLAIDLSVPEILGIEVKTRKKDIEDGVEQLERQKDFFPERGYSFIGELYVAGEGMEEVVYSRDR
jgi:hypothetical protein